MRLDFPNLHSALRAAIDDTKKVAGDDRYAIAMYTWHTPRSEAAYDGEATQALLEKPSAVCAVCMAGAVLAAKGLDEKFLCRFDMDTDVIVGLDERTSRIVEAIDCLRTGYIDDAYVVFYGTDLPDGIRSYFTVASYGDDDFYPSLEALHDYLVEKGI